jgi:hypothetical protein
VKADELATEAKPAPLKKTRGGRKPKAAVEPLQPMDSEVAPGEAATE